MKSNIGPLPKCLRVCWWKHCCLQDIVRHDPNVSFLFERPKKQKANGMDPRTLNEHIHRWFKFQCFLNVNLAFYQTNKLWEVPSLSARLRSNSSSTLKPPGTLGTIRLTVPSGTIASSRSVGSLTLDTTPCVQWQDTTPVTPFPGTSGAF